MRVCGLVLMVVVEGKMFLFKIKILGGVKSALGVVSVHPCGSRLLIGAVPLRRDFLDVFL